MKVGGRMVLTHRIAASRAGMRIVGKLVLHSCDNPPCCNPDHLSTGTHRDNTRDAFRKGRQSTTAALASPRRVANLSRGSAHHKAVLTEADIPLIRAALAQGETKTSIAARYGVTRANIYYIAIGKIWGHI